VAMPIRGNTNKNTKKAEKIKIIKNKGFSIVSKSIP
jgi:hypothetical protein